MANYKLAPQETRAASGTSTPDAARSVSESSVVLLRAVLERLEPLLDVPLDVRVGPRRSQRLLTGLGPLVLLAAYSSYVPVSFLQHSSIFLLAPDVFATDLRINWQASVVRAN